MLLQSNPKFSVDINKLTPSPNRDVKSHHEFIQTSNINWNGIFGPVDSSRTECYSVRPVCLCIAKCNCNKRLCQVWLINHFHVTIHRDPTVSWPGSAIESVQAFDIIPEISGQVDLNSRTSGRVGLMLETRSAFEQVRSAAPYLLVERFGYHLKPGVDLLGALQCLRGISHPLHHFGWFFVSHARDSCRSNKISLIYLYSRITHWYYKLLGSFMYVWIFPIVHSGDVSVGYVGGTTSVVIGQVSPIIWTFGDSYRISNVFLRECTIVLSGS